MHNSLQISFKSFDAAIFDMDGTIIDNMSYHKKAWVEFAKRHEFSVTDEDFRERFSGKKNDQILRGIFGENLSDDDIKHYGDEKEAIYRELYSLDIKPIEGLIGVLGSLQQAGKKIAVATTAPKENRDFGFHALGLQSVFDAILGEEHVTHGKPHPEIYLETAKQLGIEPYRCLVFEDTPSGVASGKAAGMTVVGILTGHKQADLQEADFHINDFRDVSFYE
ncbi:MAG TPA: HAD family phosphatase [Patescibacteria group bacterium]|nr:HAD family phosphatase [Patescibacteria group bacterium]